MADNNKKKKKPRTNMNRMYAVYSDLQKERQQETPGSYIRKVGEGARYIWRDLLGTSPQAQYEREMKKRKSKGK